MSSAGCAVGDALCFCAITGRGYYVEPTTCAGFYNCVSKTQGYYILCAAGTLFDTTCNCCNHAALVKVGGLVFILGGRGKRAGGVALGAPGQKRVSTEKNECSAGRAGAPKIVVNLK